MSEQTAVVCPGCQKENPGAEEFCGNCGTELKAQENNPVPVADTPQEQQPMDAKTLEEYKFLTLSKKSIEVHSAGSTHVGLVKENNEDAFLVRTEQYPVHKIAVHVAILADGMGGEPAGEVMGEIAANETWLGIRFLLPYFEQQHGFQKLDFWRFINRQLENHLPAQIASANTRITRYGTQKQFKKGSYGATIVVAAAVCDLETGHVRIHGYNEGDARCSLIIGEKLTQLSKDHTLGGNPYRFLGRADHVSGERFSWEVWMSEADFESFWVLLYSDGLWNMLSETQIMEQCKQSAGSEQLTSSLIEQALKVETPAGKELDERVQTGDDNITITATRISVTEKQKKGKTDESSAVSHSAVPE